jgi:hypothetical protein
MSKMCSLLFSVMAVQGSGGQLLPAVLESKVQTQMGPCGIVMDEVALGQVFLSEK